MEKARKGELLDFSTAKAVERTKAPELKKLSRQKIELAKRHAEKLVEKMRRGKENLKKDSSRSSSLKDTVYIEAMEYLDGEDLEAGLNGIARIIAE